MNAQPDQSGGSSIARLLIVAVLAAIAGFVIQRQLSSGFTRSAIEQIENDQVSRLLNQSAVGPAEPIKFVDTDGDLLADAPADADCPRPEKLVFSYVSPPAEGADEDWRGVVEALGEALGIPAEYGVYTSTAEQLTALASGELHVAGFSTGATPAAVEMGGFVPVCTFGRRDGGFGYKMQLIVPANGPIRSPGDIRGKSVVFTRPESNSGCRAAVLYLMAEHQLLPESGYEWSFSMGHANSIAGVAAGKIDVAPVASDLLESMTAAGEVDADKIRSVYESERFPPAAIGYAHNLPSDLREKITRALLEFDWAGSGLEGKYGGDGAVKFVPVSYKDDWANIRRINEAFRSARGPR